MHWPANDPESGQAPTTSTFHRHIVRHTAPHGNDASLVSVANMSIAVVTGSQGTCQVTRQLGKARAAPEAARMGAGSAHGEIRLAIKSAGAWPVTGSVWT